MSDNHSCTCEMSWISYLNACLPNCQNKSRQYPKKASIQRVFESVMRHWQFRSCFWLVCFCTLHIPIHSQLFCVFHWCLQCNRFLLGWEATHPSCRKKNASTWNCPCCFCLNMDIHVEKGGGCKSQGHSHAVPESVLNFQFLHFSWTAVWLLQGSYLLVKIALCCVCLCMCI